MSLTELQNLVLQLRIAKIRHTQTGKEKEYLLNNFPDDPVKVAWCADHTEELSGQIGTIEVPGEIGEVLIRPGFDGDAAFNATRDGQIQPSIAGTPAQVWFNLAVFPGWQKWLPTFRFGTIVADSLDFDNNTCSVCLDPSYSSAQNLDINQNQGFSECDGIKPSGFSQFCVDNPLHPT